MDNPNHLAELKAAWENRLQPTSQLTPLTRKLLKAARNIRDSIAGWRKRACLSVNTLETSLKPRNPK